MRNLETMGLFDIVSPASQDTHVGCLLGWVRLSFPHFPAHGLPVQLWTRKQRIDFLLAHSMTVTPVRLTDFFLLEFIKGVYYYPRVYPPDLHQYLRDGNFQWENYRPKRYDEASFVKPSALDTGRPEWIEYYLPAYPKINDRFPSNWNVAQKRAFFEAWDLPKLADLLDGDTISRGFRSLLHVYPTQVPADIEGQDVDEAYTFEQQQGTPIQNAAMNQARGANLHGRPPHNLSSVRTARHFAERSVRYGKLFCGET